MTTPLLPTTSALLGKTYGFVLLLLLSLLGSPLGALAQTPGTSTATVYTDKADYLPGDIVLIEGDGWQAGEQVSLTIDHSTISHGNTVLSATADGAGHIYNNEYVIQPIHLGESFTLLAAGQSSGLTAQTTFTDGDSYTATVSPQAGCPGASASFLFTITNVSTNTNKTVSTTPISSIQITLPAGFSSASLTSVPTGWFQITSPAGTIALSTTSATDGAAAVVNGAPTNPMRVGVSGTFSTTGPKGWTVTAYSNKNLTGQPLPITGSQPATTISPAPTAANAGPDRTISGTSTNLAANAPTVGTGAWTIVSGSGGALASTASPTSAFTGVIGTTYTLRWTTSNGSCTSSDDVVVAFNQVPTSLTVAPVSGTYGGAVPLSATLALASTNAGVSGKTVVFKLNGTAVGTATTNSSGTATLNNVSIAGINASSTSYSGAVTASFAAEATYAASTGAGTLQVNKATANISVTGYTGSYDGAAHGATGTATGVNGVNLSSLLTLGSSFTDAPGGAASWSFAGGTNYNDASGTAPITIGKAPSTVVLTTGGPYPYDRSAHYAQSATVTGLNNASLGNATVTYQLGGTSIAAPTNAGSYDVIASYPGSANYEAATNAAGTLVIAQAGNTISFTKPADQTYAPNKTLSLSASATSALPVSFAVVSGPASGSGNDLLITGAGPVVVEATQGGSSNYEPAPAVRQTVSVAQASQTITFAALADKTFGDADFAVSASSSASSSAGLPVSFAVSGTGSLVDGKVRITGAGTVTVTASQAGDGNYLAAAPVARTFTVAKAPATLTLSDLTPTYTGAALAVSAIPTPAGLSGVSLSYARGATAVAAPTEAGSYTVTATLSNDNYAAAPANGTLVIGKAAATVTLANLSQTYSGGAKAASATTTATGTSSFTYAYSQAGSPVAGPTNAGSYDVTATLSNANFSGANTGVLVIGKADQTITVSAAAPASAAYGSDFTVAATSTSGLPVAYSGAGPLAPKGAGVFTLTSGSGTGVVSYNQAGNANYNAAPEVTQNVAAVRINASIAVAGYTGVYDGAAHGATGTATGLNGVNLSSRLTLGSSFTNAPGGTASWSFAGGDNYNDASGTAPIVIGKAAATLALGASTFTYDGTARPVTVTSSPANLTGVGITYAGSATAPRNAGSYALAATLNNTNYEATPVSGTLLISPALLTPAITASGKEYDGTTAATLTGQSVSGMVSGDEVTLTGGTATFADANAGTGKPVTGGNFTLGGGAAANYRLPAAGPTTPATITPATLTYAATPASRRYGNANGPLSGAATGFVNGETAATALTGSAAFTSAADAASPVGRYAITGAGLVANHGNYTFAQAAANATALTVTARPITIMADAGQTKGYGAADPTPLTYAVGGEGLAAADAFSGALSRAPGNSAGAYPIGQGTLSIVNRATQAATLSNYALSFTPGVSFAITPKTLTASITASSKVYDGGPAAAATGSVPAADVVAGDALTVAVSNAAFDSKQVGAGKTVTANVALSGAAAANYTLSAATATAPADITAKALVVAVSAQDKGYDGTATASVAAAISGGLVSGDAVAVSAGNGLFNNKNVGTGKAVTASISTAGADAGNYAANAAASTTASITAKTLVAAVTAGSKTYDALPTATVTGRSLSGQVSTDDVSLSGGTALFANKNAGTGKPVTVTGLRLSGADAANYSFNATATTTADITPLNTTASFTAKDKGYDGLPTATVVTTAVTQAISGDNVTFSGGTAAFDTKKVGTGKTVTLTGAALAGPDAANYRLTTVGSTTASITARPLLVTATGLSKVFDGSAAATVTLSDNRVAGDVLTAAYASAAFDNATAGPGKTVAVSGISITGTDAPNYAANVTASATASITAAETSVAVSSSGPVQYSDQVSFTASITSPTAQSVLNATGGTVEFRLNGVTLGASAYPADWNATTGTVSKSFVITQKAGSYPVTAVFTPGSLNLTGASGTGALGVTKENASVVYAGAEYFGTASSTSNVANVEYLSTFTDAADPNRGTITNAKAAFKDAAGTVLFGTPFDISLLNPADATVGGARTGVKTVTLTNAEVGNGGKTFELTTEAQGDYYGGGTAGPTLITIAVPGQDYVNGGGSVVTQASSGTYAATPGAKMNFGFTMKWNKSGQNIQGQANIIFRRQVAGAWRTYQIKSNAINTLGTTSTALGNQGDFNTKANLTDITDPLLPVAVGGGGLDLTVQAFESVVAGSPHKIGVTLRSSAGTLLFSNNWTGAKTDMQALNGGKISVRSTAPVTTAATTAAVAPAKLTSPTAPTPSASLNAAETSADVPGATDLLEVYPNPLAAQSTVRFHTARSGKAQVYLYDQLGQLVATLHNAEVQGGRDYCLPLPAGQLESGVYFCRLIANGKVENRRVMVVK